MAIVRSECPRKPTKRNQQVYSSYINRVIENPELDQLEMSTQMCVIAQPYLELHHQIDHFLCNLNMAEVSNGLPVGMVKVAM